jgi:hypothetical protein
MSRGNISLLGQNADFRILTERIWARNDHSGGTLVVPFKIEIGNLDNERRLHPTKVEIISMNSFLRTAEGGLRCSASHALTNHTLYPSKLSFEGQFNYFLPYDVLNKLENSRKGDLKLNMDVMVQAAICGDIKFQAGSVIPVVKEISQGSGNISFEIPQSSWVNILGQLGYGAFTLIELPSFHNILPEEYKSAIAELEKARQYFVGGDYDKCAGHCRVAIEPIKKKISELKKVIESDTKYEWVNSTTEATINWLGTCLKSTYGLTSKSHHPQSFGHFSRKEAEAVLIVTTGIIYYISITSYQTN